MVGTKKESTKPWYASKAVWGSVLIAAVAVAKMVETGEVSPEWIAAIAASLGLFGLRDAA